MLLIGVERMSLSCIPLSHNKTVTIMTIEASGQNLEQTRKIIGIAQKDLYQAVNVSRATYHNWVVGKSEPSASQFFTMLQVCWTKRNPDASPALFNQQVNKLINLASE